MTSFIAGFNAIHLVQSLRPGDLETGEQSYYHIRSTLAALRPQPLVALHRTPDLRSFAIALGAIAEETKRSGAVPLLQLDAHGDKSGIQLSSDEHVPWSTLASLLTAINEGARSRLLVVLAACHGMHLVQTIQPYLPSPFGFMTGPSREVEQTALLWALLAFYRALFSDSDSEPLAAANEILRPQRATFIPYAAEHVFH